MELLWLGSPAGKASKAVVPQHRPPGTCLAPGCPGRQLWPNRRGFEKSMTNVTDTPCMAATTSYLNQTRTSLLKLSRVTSHPGGLRKQWTAQVPGPCTPGQPSHVGGDPVGGRALCCSPSLGSPGGGDAEGHLAMVSPTVRGPAQAVIGTPGGTETSQTWPGWSQGHSRTCLSPPMTVAPGAGRGRVGPGRQSYRAECWTGLAGMASATETHLALGPLPACCPPPTPMGQACRLAAGRHRAAMSVHSQVSHWQRQIFHPLVHSAHCHGVSRVWAGVGSRAILGCFPRGVHLGWLAMRDPCAMPGSHVVVLLATPQHWPWGSS